MLLLLLLLINFHRFSPMVIDFSSISWIFSDGRRFFMNFHRFSMIFIDFQLRSLPPARGAVRDPLQELIPEQIPVLGAKCMKNHTNSMVFAVFGAKMQECLQFFKITTTFTVQIAIYWQRYRVLFRRDSPIIVPIFGGPAGGIPK